VKDKVTVLIPCRDGESTLGRTLESLLAQTVKTDIVIANDASIDSTPKIIEKIKFTFPGRIKSVMYPRREHKSYSRVPILLNMAIKETNKKGQFVMISGDDSIYPLDYLEKLINHMRNDKVDISSGFINKYSSSEAPSGSGRVLSYTIFMMLIPFPENIGWESWMLYKAKSLGKKMRVYPVKFEHSKPYSYKSTWTFGQSAYLNGSPFIFTLARSLKAMILREHTPLNALSLIFGHMEYMLRRPQKLDTSEFVENMQKYRLKEAVMRPTGLIM
jgi:glycosyltransferase involved in cell wall biosynthesis